MSPCPHLELALCDIGGVDGAGADGEAMVGAGSAGQELGVLVIPIQYIHPDVGRGIEPLLGVHLLGTDTRMDGWMDALGADGSPAGGQALPVLGH